MEIRTWTIEDHLCRKCGGKILRCATGTGMSSGRESMYRCAELQRFRLRNGLIQDMLVRDAAKVPFFPCLPVPAVLNADRLT